MSIFLLFLLLLNKLYAFAILKQIYSHANKACLQAVMYTVIFFLLYKILAMQQETKKSQVLDSARKYCELIGQK